jgi:hypothetical protein
MLPLHNESALTLAMPGTGRLSRSPQVARSAAARKMRFAHSPRTGLLEMSVQKGLAMMALTHTLGADSIDCARVRMLVAHLAAV